MQLCTAFPWKSASAVSKPELDFPKGVGAPGGVWVLVFLAGGAGAGCSCRREVGSWVPALEPKIV